MYQLVIKKDVIRMMQNAYEWYEQQQPKLGDAFMDALEHVYKKITIHPEYFSTAAKKYRQVRISRFPYVVIYEIMKKDVVVFAVFHTSRNPKRKFKK